MNHYENMKYDVTTNNIYIQVTSGNYFYEEFAASIHLNNAMHDA